jgi:nucleoside-diphosphate-sugar epimerase
VHESDPGLQKVVDALLSLEHQLLTANRQGRIEAIPLRYGLTYGPENPSTEYMVRMLRKRMLPTLQGVKGISSFIHTADAATATLAALEHGRPGEIYNVVDDEPVSINAFLTALAAAIKASPPFALPLWFMRWIAPFLVASVSVRLPLSNAKAKQELGWALQFPTYRGGVQQVAQQVQFHGQKKQ